MEKYYSLKTDKETQWGSLRNMFRVLFMGVAIVHLFFTVFYLLNGKEIFALYQFAASLLFIFLYKVWKSEHFILYCNIYFVEMVVNSFLTAYFWGDVCASNLYLLSMILIANCIVFTQYPAKVKQKYIIVNLICSFLMFMVLSMPLLTLYLFPHKYFAMDYKTAYFSSLWIIQTFYTLSAFLLLFFTTVFFMRNILWNFDKVEEEKDLLDTEASQDALTKLYNRRKIEELFKNSWAQWQKNKSEIVIGIGDIDFFKKLNDRYGHPAGDAVLVNIASLFMTSARKGDIICRWGGEEFLFICQCSESDSVFFFERLRKKIEETPIAYEKENLTITMTFGISKMKIGQKPEDLITAADQNLYAGKEGGRNRVYHDFSG